MNQFNTRSNGFPSATYNNSNPSKYPIKALPDIIQKPVLAMCIEKKAPVEIVAGLHLAVISLACLPLIEAIPAHTTKPEPAAINFMIIASSGMGKSTIAEEVMQSVFRYINQERNEYHEEIKQYKIELGSWEETRKAYARNLRRAIHHNFDGNDERQALENHDKNKPKKPARHKIVYNDVSRQALIRGLSENPCAGIYLEEGISFLKARLKDDPGLLNMAWGGSNFSYQREDIDIDMQCIVMFIIQVQPDVFDEYIEKHQKTARGSGFLSRFIMSKTTSLPLYQPTDKDYSYLNASIDIFNEWIYSKFVEGRQKLRTGDTSKIRLTLSPQANQFMGEKRAEIRNRISKGGDLEHISDAALKSGANTLRLAMLFHYIDGREGNEISLKHIEGASSIIEWHLHQANMIFYKDSSQFKFEQSAREILYWISDRMTRSGSAIISKTEILKYGPNRYRRADILTPILEQLAWQNCISLVQNCSGGPIYIVLPNQSGVVPDLSFRQDLFPHGFHFIRVPDTPDRVILNIPNLTFSW